MHCLEAVRSLSEQRDHPLPLRRRIALRFHVFVCVLCRAYRNQMRVVCNVARHAGESPCSHGAVLSPARKQSMQDAINRSRD